MPPKRKRGRPRHKLSQPLNSRKNLVFEKDIEVSENLSKEVMEYICSYCKKSFKKRQYLIAHVNSCGNDTLHEEKPKLHCPKCTKVFVFKKSYKKHVENEHYEGPDGVCCEHCSVICPNKEILQDHLDKKHNSGTYSCQFCTQTFVRRAHVTRHMLQKGCDGRKLREFSCGICSAKFSRKDNLLVHLRLQHIMNKRFQCKMCDFSTKNFSKLILHSQRMHLPKPLQYECDHCGKLTKSRGSLTKHLEIHGDKKYACEVCGYSTYTIEVMRRHTLTHVEDKPYKCSICSNSFIQKAQLLRHLNQHMEFVCNICSKRFKTREEATIHEGQHDPNDLSCPFEDCTEKKFEDEEHQSIHIKEHLQAFKCEVCGKPFEKEINMRRHVPTHALDRPRRCMYCVNARAYVRGEHLLRHVRKHHADVFMQRLMHVRSVLGSYVTTPRVTTPRVSKSELDAILNMLDAESDRIIEDYGTGVLYGGLQDINDQMEIEIPKNEPNTLLSEEELVENLKELLSKLIDQELLEAFGWPDKPIEDILEKVIENCGARPADREKWSRVQCLRENTKHLFIYVVEDKNIAKMLGTHTIDQVIMHILQQVSDNV
ncbi:protein suppressor of hairy wing [Pieris brassicae]|uniref:protein suppressor of hairy wing n=1 Tax=Pieris brassicae TaxID=7116 RepID=UPI001E661624|nr:protein suppressor of hairy wing [Pieris brassicae]